MLNDLKNYYPTREFVEKYKGYKIYKASGTFITADLGFKQPVSFLEIEVSQDDTAYAFIFYSTLLSDVGVVNTHSKEDMLSLVLEKVKSVIDFKDLKMGKVSCLKFNGSDFFETANKKLIERIVMLEQHKPVANQNTDN